VGVVLDGRVIDLSRAAPELPTEMTPFLAAGESAMSAACNAARQSSENMPLSSVRLEAPVRRPGKFLGIGANYPGKGIPNTSARDLERMRQEGSQLWFNKQVTCINGPFDPIELPRAAREITFEPELAMVIGKRCRHVPTQRALEVVAGYVICNDVTALDWVTRSPTATLAKSFDTHGPLGPWIVTADEIDPSGLAVRGFVNGELRQSGSTADMLFRCEELIAYLSQVFTLEPGDVLTTGSPAGSKSMLKAADVVRCEIEGIGHIENSVIAEA
jgi:2-keto-4-pentenoate hydratase/2-oxohepta-3-ene-1,7-dioic acid hydratase in catechol pathway